MSHWTDLQKALAHARTPIEDGLGYAPESTRELQRTLLDALARPTPPAADAAFYGAFLALFGPRATYRHPSRWLDVTRFAASIGGGDFLVDVVLASRSWDHRTGGHVGIYTKELFWIEPTTAPPRLRRLARPARGPPRSTRAPRRRRDARARTSPSAADTPTCTGRSRPPCPSPTIC